jgi:hypothetical protein
MTDELRAGAGQSDAAVRRRCPGGLRIRHRLLPAAVTSMVWALAASLAAGPASADEAFCKRQGQFDQQATQTLQQMLERTDPQLVQFLAGTWYFEARSPSTNQVSYMYYQFGPDTLFAYQNRVCSGTGCNDYQGAGLFAGIPIGNGQYTMLLSISDLNRDHECSGFALQISGNTVRDSSGQAWSRVR